MTPFAILGITSAFWAMIAGMTASLLAERRDLFASWRSDASSNQPLQPGERRG